jgi:BASS family bile acid:Na+ symporter
LALGHGLSSLLRQDANSSRTIALDTSIHNGPLAILIVTLSFVGSIQQDISLIQVLYSLSIVTNSSLVAVPFRHRSDREALTRDKLKAGQLMARY